MFKIQKLSNLAVMESGNRRRRGAKERSDGGTEESCGGRAEEIGGAVTLRRDGEEMENRKTGKSMLDGGVIGGDGGRWRDRR